MEYGGREPSITPRNHQNIDFGSKIDQNSLLPPCKRPQARIMSKTKNRNINLTLGVFGVVPSYLVRIDHILYVFNQKKDEKLFFQQKSQILIKKSTFGVFFKNIRNVENFDQNLRFLVEYT